MSATVVPLGGGTTGFGHGHHRELCHDEHDTTRLRDDGAMGWIMPVIGIALLLLLVLGIACLVKYLLSSK
ncbi:hypothetical protein HAALTHF_53880n [Vreelandella aquamarina]|nr:hypothetical protein HAALTHF_53880n [Halomonas axialensis]